MADPGACGSPVLPNAAASQLTPGRNLRRCYAKKSFFRFRRAPLYKKPASGEAPKHDA